MSRIVRHSKYRHVYGAPAKKEHCIDNVKVSNSAWDTNMISASASYISVNWNASGGGAFGILPLPSPFTPHPLPHKLPDIIPLARGHTAAVLDTDWSPHDDALVASGGEDGKILMWKVDQADFEGWGQDKWVPRDFEPVYRIAGSPKRIGQVLFHPTAKHVLASATGEHLVKFWDLGSPEDPKSVLTGHTDTIQSIAFNMTGTLLATTCRDRKLRLFDPRAGGEAVRITDGHGGIKGARVTFMADKDYIASTGFSRMSDRQVSIYDTSGLKNVKTVTIDQSAGVIMPFYTDNNILFLAGKGDGNIRYYEYESESLHNLAEYQSSAPQRGMCFLPRRALNVSECEIARAYKISGSLIEPIAFIVPRKADTFQSDIYPPALSAEPAMTAGEFFTGKFAPPKLINLDSGQIFSGTAPSAIPSSAPPSSSSSAPAAPPLSSTPSLSPTISISSPTPLAEPTRKFSTPMQLKKKNSPSISISTMSRQTSEPLPIPAHESRVTSPTALVSPPLASATSMIFGSASPESPMDLKSPPSASASDTALKGENASLTAELREARAMIRNLELQVEGLKANAHRAAKALLDGGV